MALINGFKTVFGQKRGWLIFISATALVAVILPSLPAAIAALDQNIRFGEALKNQVLFLNVGWPVVAAFSILTGLLFAGQAHIFSKRSAAGTGGIATAGSFAAMFGAGCPACLAAVFGVLGITGSAFTSLINYKNPIILAGLILVSISILFIYGKIGKGCEHCLPNGK